jgi:hypothetical protein
MALASRIAGVLAENSWTRIDMIYKYYQASCVTVALIVTWDGHAHEAIISTLL